MKKVCPPPIDSKASEMKRLLSGALRMEFLSSRRLCQSRTVRNQGSIRQRSDQPVLALRVEEIREDNPCDPKIATPTQRGLVRPVRAGEFFLEAHSDE